MEQRGHASGWFVTQGRVGRCRADCAFGAPFVPNGGMTSVSSQASGAKRRLCWMQRRLRRKSGRRRSIALQVSMGAAAPIARSAPPFVPNGRDGAPPPSQDSGAKRRLRGVCEFERATKQGRLRRKSGRRRSIALQVLNGAAALLAGIRATSRNVPRRQPPRRRAGARRVQNELPRWSLPRVS